MTRFIVLCALLVCASPVCAALTEAPRLAAVYSSILAAQFDRADAELAQACPPAPVEACAALAVVSLWWQIQLTPESTSLDGRFNDLAAQAIAASERVDQARAHTRRSVVLPCRFVCTTRELASASGRATGGGP